MLNQAKEKHDMDELSGIERDDREDRAAAQGQSRRQEQRFEAALAFTVAACDRKGMATDHDIRYAVMQADRMFVYMDKTKDELDDG